MSNTSAKPSLLQRLWRWRIGIPLRGRKLAVPGLFLLLLLCCLCTVSTQVFAPPRTPTPSPTSVAAIAAPTGTPISPAATSAPLPTVAPTVPPPPAPTRTVAPTRTTAPTPSPTPLPIVGSEVKLGNMTWVILAAKDLGSVLKSDNQFTKDVTTSGRFVSVRYRITNGGTSEIYYQTPDLYDSAKRRFGSATNVLTWIPEVEWCIFEKLNPGITKTCTAIYEMPLDAQSLVAQVTELGALLGKNAQVDLGLNKAQ
jgi:hypothetical protein